MHSQLNIWNRKVAIIGAGYVGSTIAYALSLREIAREIVLIDVNKEKALGEAMDIRHGLSGLGITDVYAGDYSDCSDCDMIIITAGRNRRPGESRTDLIADNAEIMYSVVCSIKKYYTRGVIMLISNPVDILTQLVSEWMALPNGYVFGTGCILDTSRLIRLIADYLGLDTGVINGYVIGEHGDNQVPVWSKVLVGGIPINDYCEEMNIPWNKEIRTEIEEKTKTMGSRIIQAKDKTHFGIANCAAFLAGAVINQRPVIASVTSPLLGEHGVKGISLSVPSVVSASGIQQRIREKWTPLEYEGFFKAVEKVRNVLETYKAD